MRRIILLALAVFLVAGAADQPSQRASGDGIILLNLTLVNGEVRLDSMIVADGKLKRPKKLTLIAEHVHFEATDSKGKTLFEGITRDPSHVRYEYADEQGKLQTKWVVRDSASFVVRMPYDAAIRQVKFHKIDAAPKVRGPVTEPGSSLGSILVDLGGQTDEK